MTSIFTRKHYINFISIFLIWIAGALFILQTFSNPDLKALLYSVAFWGAVFLIERTEKIYAKILTKNFLFLIVLIITASLILLYRLEYIGYPAPAAFSILWLAILYQWQTAKVSLLQLAVFGLSPVLYSEMISFSGAFSLSMLILVSIFISERFLEPAKLDWKFFLIALLFGITISSNLIIGFVYGLYLLYLFRNELIKGLVFVVIIFAVVLLSKYLPEGGYFRLAFTESQYYEMYLPVWVYLVLFMISIYVGWIVSDLQEVLFINGIMLFIISMLVLFFKPSAAGFSFNETNLSFFLMAIPFLVLSIKDYRVDRFLGKVLQ